MPDLVTRLRAAGCVFAEDEAAVLESSAGSAEELAAMVARRVAGEPLEYVVGWVEVAGVRVSITPGVFIPRQRTAFLVELAAAGLGATFLPRMIVAQRPHPGIAAVPLAEPDAEWNMAMIWRRGAYLSHAAQAWLALVRERATPA